MAVLFASEVSHWIWDVVGMLAVPAIVALNGVFVAAEFALVSVRKTRVEELVRHKVIGALAVETALHHLDRSIATTQLGITLTSLGLGWVGEPALADLLRPLFASLPEPVGTVAAHSLGTVAAFFLITFMHVVFGELVPKNMALQAPDRIALWLASPLTIFTRLTRPLTLLMNLVANWVLRSLGYKMSSEAEMVHSVEELALLIEDTEEAGIIDEDQATFVQNVFRLSDKRVRDCMAPREKMAALELNTPPDVVLERARLGAHTRMPVYSGDLDNIVGIVNTKDLFYLFSLKGVVVLEDALYPAIFLDPDERVATALRQFKQARRPMALVRDQLGKILGLLTLEDVLEEIVGDIEDEHDRPTPKLALRGRRTMRSIPLQSKPPVQSKPPSAPPG